MATTDPTLLLQDLLSPPSPAYPPPLLLRQLTLHLGSLIPLDTSSSSPQLKLVELLARYAASSPALWDALPAEKEGEEGWETLRGGYEAMKTAVLLRLEGLSRPAKPSPSRTSSTPAPSSASSYSTRRLLHSFLSALLAGLTADAAPLVRPSVRLALTSGVLSALQEWKRRREGLWVGGGKGVEGWEGEVGRAWGAWSGARGAGNELFPAWLAAQTIPFVEADVLAKSFPVPALLRYLTATFSTLFSHGRAFTSPPLSLDLAHDPPFSYPSLLHWTVPSPSHTSITALVAHPLFTLLGPLSRALGRTAEAAALVARTRPSAGSAPDALSAIQALSTTLLGVASEVSAGWAATEWSDVLDDAGLSPATRSETAPWTLLKTLLFAQTLIYSSLLQIVAPSSSDGAEPTPVQRQLATQALQALGKTYFVALRFGQSGFAAWRAVLGGLVEVVAAEPGSSLWGGHAVKAGENDEEEEEEEKETPAETLARSLEPARGTGQGGRHDRAVERAEATFWMNTVELVVPQLGEGYVERRVLRGVRPYLDDATYRDSFEAAHSVMLAFFAAGKASARDVAPWYIELLLRTYPALLSPSQFRLAYSAVVAAVSSTDDALAWWAVQELLAKIETLPVSSSSPSASSAPSPTSPSSSTLDTRALSLPRGAHLLTLTSLLPSLSLRLFPLALSSLETLLRLEPPESDGRKALVEYLFGVLGEGMDAAKRAEGTRWWMERGVGVAEGGPLPEQGEVEEVEEEQVREAELEEAQENESSVDE
ncbi:hypothetical protein JCM6882_002547 [Rhodosporidiobolus microsporus]